jgi:exodeoxyribonuclease V alpha subunit
MPDAASPAEPPRKELRGIVERITYQNPENGYTVARLAPERPSAEARAVREQASDYLVTVVGTLADLSPGEAIVAHGWWKNDAKYGWQFVAVDYRTALPATLQGMKKYLGSGLVKGVGPVNAGRIVDAFGEETFEVIDTSPDRLREVPGIGPIRAGRIAAAWEEQRHIREVMAALQGYGISTSLAVRIYKRFGDDSGRVIQREPYRLAREVWGIGFKTADKIAKAVGIAADAPERLQAGLLHALAAAADEGHTLLPAETLLAQATALLGADEAAVAAAVDPLLDNGDLIAVHPADAGADAAPAAFFALAPFARAESGLASRLRALQAAGNRAGGTPAGRIFGSVDWAAAFGWLEARHRLVLAPEQQAAVRMALIALVSLLTGGPGTGKTHSLRAVLELARAKRLRCILAAPTGRAAKRMEEATGLPAGTLHRVLELRPGGAAGRNPDRPLEADLIVVDETSMLDSLLANQLVKAIAPGAHLLLVGDPDQLPSVGAGDVLADLLRTDQFPVTRLTHVYRQGAGSGIALNAQRINRGETPLFGRSLGALGATPDCFLIPADSPAEAAQQVVDLVAHRLPARYGFKRGEVQVLVPMHRGEAGVGALNTLLQEHLNPYREGVPEVRSGGRTYRPGDRVLQLKNDYDLEVFNGDLGTVTAADPVEQQLVVRLDDGRDIVYPSASLFALTHAAAMTVHKSQGAEFPAVVLPLLTGHTAMLSRTLLYTAVTRARRLLVVVGQYKALRLAVGDWRREPRHTALGGLLAGSLRYRWPRQRATLASPDGDADDDPPGDSLWEGLLTAKPGREL